MYSYWLPQSANWQFTVSHAHLFVRFPTFPTNVFVVTFCRCHRCRPAAGDVQAVQLIKTLVKFFKWLFL